jgi:hypothetical protein
MVEREWERSTNSERRVDASKPMGQMSIRRWQPHHLS